MPHFYDQVEWFAVDGLNRTLNIEEFLSQESTSLW